MDRLIKEFVSEMLDELPAEAINRLVEPSEPIGDEDLAFLTNQELEAIKRAHCDDIEAGRPDDGVYYRVLLCRIRAEKQRAGASFDAATNEAAIEAAHIIEELMKNMELEGRSSKRDAPSLFKNIVANPQGVLKVYAFVNQQWQERNFKLYRPTRDGKAEEIDPMGRRIGWFEKRDPFDIDFVTDKPYIKKEGEDWLRAAVAKFVCHSFASKQKAYAARVAEFSRQGSSPPRQTTKSGVLGDLEWARKNGVSRPIVEKWRSNMLPDKKRGRRPNSARNSTTR